MTCLQTSFVVLVLPSQSFLPFLSTQWASQVVLVVKNPPASAGDIRDVGWIPGLGRFPRRGHGNQLQYCCPWIKEPGGLQSIGSQRVRYDWSDLACVQHRNWLTPLLLEKLSSVVWSKVEWVVKIFTSHHPFPRMGAHDTGDWGKSRRILSLIYFWFINKHSMLFGMKELFMDDFCFCWSC